MMMLVVNVSCSQDAVSTTNPNEINIDLNLNLGEDVGQNLGTLFEIEDGLGNVIMGAGFPDIYNTRKRVNHRSLNVFIETDKTGEFQSLGRPFEDSFYIRLINYNGTLYAFNRANSEIRSFDPNENVWLPTDEIESYNGFKVNDKIVKVVDGSLFYGDDLIFEIEGYNLIAYYFNGSLYIHATNGVDDQYLYVCPWKYDDSQPVDLETCNQNTFEYDKVRFPYTFGVYENEVLLNLNNGDRFSYHDGELTLIHEDQGTSNQIYSLLTTSDRVYAGHYPSGQVLTYDGVGDYRFQSPNIQIPTETNNSQREAQTLQLYAGKLFAGVWPYGELHMYDFNADEWTFLRRLFSHPDDTSATYPYYQLMNNKNNLGQRIVDMENIGSNMYIALTAKASLSNYSIEDLDFLTPEQAREYGSVYRYQKDYNLACNFNWPPDGKTTISVNLTNDELSVAQDNSEICSINVDQSDITIDESTIQFAKGIFGDYGGNSITNIGE